MNIHPIVVHFPVALLTLYSLMEIFQFRKLRSSRPWQIVKAVFLILGTFFSVAAFITGGWARELVGTSKLIELHSTFGLITLLFFIATTLLVGSYNINTQTLAIKNWLWNTVFIRSIWRILSKISDAIVPYYGILILIGIIGLCLITITGALGGTVVYGSDMDPFTSFIYRLFF